MLAVVAKVYLPLAGCLKSRPQWPLVVSQDVQDVLGWFAGASAHFRTQIAGNTVLSMPPPQLLTSASGHLATGTHGNHQQRRSLASVMPNNPSRATVVRRQVPAPLQRAPRITPYTGHQGYYPGY